MKVNYDPIIFCQHESLNYEDFVIATYAMWMKTSDWLRRAGAIAVEQTTGTWMPVPHETPEVRRRHVGRVVGVYPVPSYEDAWPKEQEEKSLIVQIAFPWKNFGHQIAEMLSSVQGNISMAGKIKLLDLEFPESFTAGFSGPKFGVQGLRELMHVPQRPLILGMIKPCTGADAKTTGEIYEELARAGVELIKDDELIADPEHAPFEKRLEYCLEAGLKAEQATGNKSIYFINITDRPDRMLTKARRAIELGANGLMVNVQTTGFGTIAMLADMPEVKVPILSHPCYAGTGYMSPHYGIASNLALGKFQRLDGADIVVYAAAYGKVGAIRERYIRTAQTLLSKMHNLKPILPLPAAGLHPGMVPTVMHDLGPDIVIGCGGAMHGHPGGLEAGVKAILQSIEATLNNVPLEDAAREHKELKQALDTWGIFDPNKSIFELTQ